VVIRKKIKKNKRNKTIPARPQNNVLFVLVMDRLLAKNTDTDNTDL